MGNHALIFGATGIQGWAVTRELLNGYPSTSAFDRITALTNRPITGEMLWPKSDKLQVVSGIDLLGDNVVQEMKERISDINGVTHVFFFAYIYKENPDAEIAINVELLKQAISSVQSLSTKLNFVLLPTGTKAYGVHLLDKFPFADKLPLSEDLPRIPEPFASQNFYYHQTDWLEAASRGKEWSWCEIRPDVVIGFVPNNNVYCLAQTLATYLACYREVEGDGAECAFPGTELSWKALSNDSDQDTIARCSIHAALHPKTCGQGRAFNIASNSEASSWQEKWPVVCDFFGLRGTPPPPHGTGPQPGQYLSEHLEQWHELERSHGLVTGRVGNDRSLASYQSFIMTSFNFDRSLDLGRQKQACGQAMEEKDNKQVWWTAFHRFRDAKIIP